MIFRLYRKLFVKPISRQGFTLIEALIAFFILTMGISFIYSIFPLGMRVARQTQTLSSVSFFAQKKLEELKTSAEPVADSTGQENIFNWTVKVTDYTTEENIVLKKVQLDVLWSEGENQRKKTFITYFK
ncbi:MAG: prepilin-type N-terminal cleavage/methylation domain-containing protein [Candidatus Omnitrophica bacterium]|nr:prepilin-type N-terminal cleavage/methylation domain-containing protein [Candidatus Omnitrophota bacterium]MDD5356285.1 prepilin-type N-terminal cleavage/methylation domain-containing protein [Candidatus Omnitrophota bacterium]